MMTTNVVQIPVSEEPVPQVSKQKTWSEIEVANGGALPLGSWVLAGEQIGIVRSHNNGRAIVALTYQLSEARWGRVRTAAQMGALVEPLPADVWQALLRSQFPSGLHVGTVRQDHVSCPCHLPFFGRQRVLFVGKSGSGKSTAIISAVINARNDLEERRVPRDRRPALIAFDPHGDFLGRVREEDSDHLRPNLVHCLRETPIVLGRGSLTCRVRDLPPSLLVKALGTLSDAQKRWADRYAIDDEDYSGIEHLLYEKHEPAWPTLFPDLATNGEMTQTQRESLKTLRARMRTITAPPLFSHDNTSSWRSFFDHVDAGRVLIVDVNSFPEAQRVLLINLVLLTVRRRQEECLRSAKPLKPITFVGDELHEFAGAYDNMERLARGGRKFGIGTIYGTQSLSHLPKDVVSQATIGVVFQSEGQDGTDVVKRWKELRAVASEIGRLEVGEAFVIARNTPWPVKFEEPPFLPEALRRKVYTPPPPETPREST